MATPHDDQSLGRRVQELEAKLALQQQETRNAQLRAELVAALAAERHARQQQGQEQAVAMQKMESAIREHALKAELLEKRIETKLAMQRQMAQLEAKLKMQNQIAHLQSQLNQQVQSSRQHPLALPQLLQHPQHDIDGATALAADAEAERILQEAKERARKVRARARGHAASALGQPVPAPQIASQSATERLPHSGKREDPHANGAKRSARPAVPLQEAAPVSLVHQHGRREQASPKPTLQSKQPLVRKSSSASAAISSRAERCLQNGQAATTRLPPEAIWTILSRVSSTPIHPTMLDTPADGCKRTVQVAASAAFAG